MNRYFLNKNFSSCVLGGTKVFALPLSLREYIKVIGDNGPALPENFEDIDGWVMQNYSKYSKFSIYFWISEEKFTEPNIFHNESRTFYY